jgi:hypothetical protein
MAAMNLRVTKLFQGAPHGSIEVAFNSCAEGTRLVEELKSSTGLKFERPIANRFALRELHIAEVGGEDELEQAFVRVLAVAEKYDEVHDAQKNMKGPDELTPEELDRAMKDHGR